MTAPCGRRTAVLAAVAIAAFAPASAAAAGPVNPGFEQGLAGWSATSVSLVPDEYGDPAPPVPVGCQVPNGVCAVGVDTFTAEGGLPPYGDPTPVATRAYRVAPVAGTRMARLGGPFTSPLQFQPLEHYRLEQAFVVDGANPVLAIAYNVFAYDYTGFDDLRVQVRVTDAAGRLISDQAQSAEGSGVLLRTTGWRQAQVDLTGWAGETVHVRLEAGGSSDTAYPFWAYVDVGKAPGGAVGKPTATSAVALDVQNDADTGDRWFRAEASAVATCRPVTIAVPITGTVSDVVLRHVPADGDPRLDLPMTRNPTTGQWQATVPCLETARLAVAYDVTDAAGVEHRNQNIGGLVAANSMGTVYDKATFDKLRAKGTPVPQAIAKASLGGAAVQLLRSFSGTLRPVLSGEAATFPHVTPQTTPNSGRFGWSLPPGTYAVRVTKKGYATVTTAAATVPPQVTGLDVALVTSKKAALRTDRLCGSRRGALRHRCRADRRLARRLARCQQKRRATARRACTRRVRGR